MQVVAFSSARSGHDGELQQFERLAATLSSRFARLHVEEIGPAIVGALEQTGRAIDVDACALIEFTEGAISAMHTWPSAEATFGEAGCPPRWLVDRLTHREVVPIPAIDDAPVVGRDGVRPADDRSGLGVPVVVADQVVCALVIWGRRSARRWSDPVVERVRLIAEIFGVALQRCRQESALRASLATIERLNVEDARSLAGVVPETGRDTAHMLYHRRSPLGRSLDAGIQSGLLIDQVQTSRTLLLFGFSLPFSPAVAHAFVHDPYCSEPSHPPTG